MSIYDAVRAILRTPFNNYQIAASVDLSETTVRRYRRILREKDLTWDLLKDLDDAALYAVFNKPRRGRVLREIPDLALIDAELTASGMDLQGWYEDHQRTHPNPSGLVSYSHLAAKLKQYRSKTTLSMRQVHTPGEKVFVDYCGDAFHYTDPKTGERIRVQVFVGVLCASSLSFATATHTQSVPDFLVAHERMFAYFGGHPDAIVPDNLASAVSHPGPDRKIQRSYADFAAHYDTMVLPARPYHPKDKAKAEAGVKYLQCVAKRVFYRRKFMSLDDVNVALAELIERINNRPMKGPMKGRPSRREQFETYERSRLLPLPATPYVYAEWQTIKKVNQDYHALVDGHFYSVPHTLVGERLDVRIEPERITIFKERKEVASHIRNHAQGKTTSNLAHMSDGHRAQAQRAPNLLREWATEAGPNILRFVREQLDQERPIRGVQATETLRKLAKDHGNARVEAALEQAYRRGKVNVTALQRSIAATRATTTKPTTTLRNVRATRAYSGARHAE